MIVLVVSMIFIVSRLLMLVFTYYAVKVGLQYDIGLGVATGSPYKRCDFAGIEQNPMLTSAQRICMDFLFLMLYCKCTLHQLYEPQTITYTISQWYVIVVQ